MKRRTSILAVLLLAAGLAFAAGGKYRQDKPRVSSPGMGMNAQASVLTEDEQKAFYTAKMDFEKKATPLRADIKVLRLEINELILAGKSEKEISSTLSKLNIAKAKLADARLAHQVSVRKIVGEDNYRKMGMHYKAMNQRGQSGPQMGYMKSGRGQKVDCPYGNQPRYKNR